MNSQSSYLKGEIHANNSSNQQSKLVENIHPSSTFKIKPQRIENSDSEQRQGCQFEDSDNNPIDDQPLTDIDISFEENNTNFLKTQKYKKPSLKHTSDSSQESEIDDQYYKGKSDDVPSSSHQMSNYIDQLKKEKNSFGYKNNFEKKKNTNQPFSIDKTQIKNEKRHQSRGQDSNSELKEDQTFQQLRESTSSQKYNKGYKQDYILPSSKGAPIINHQNSFKRSNENAFLKENLNENAKNKINNQKIQSKLTQMQQNEYSDKTYNLAIKNNNQHQYVQQKYQQDKQHLNEFYECEEKSEEYKSSSVPSSEQPLNDKFSQQMTSNDFLISQPFSDVCQADSKVDEDQYFTLENKAQIIESIDINNYQNGIPKPNQVFRNEQINQQNTLKNHNHQNIQFHQQNIPNNPIPNTHLDKISKIADSYYDKSPIQNKNNSLVTSQNQSSSKQQIRTQQSNDYQDQDQGDTQIQSYILSSYNGHSNNSKGKSANKQFDRSNSHVLLTSNSKSSSSFTVFGQQDEQSINYSPLHKLNLYKHSGKSNQKSQEFGQQSNALNKSINDISPIVNQPSAPLPQQINWIYDKKQQPQLQEQKQQLNSHNQISKNTSNLLQKEFLEKNYCKQVQSYEALQEKENRFYIERKRSLDKKLNELQHINSNNDHMKNNSFENMNKEEYLQVISERLVLELRMANKIITFLECQNKFFQKKLEGIDEIDEKGKKQTLSNFVCTNCQSSSFYEKDENVTFSRIAKSQQNQTSSHSNQSQSQAERIVVNENIQSQYQNNQNHFNSGVEGSSQSLKKQSSFNNLTSNHTYSQQDQSLHEDFKNLVKDFQSLKQMSLKQQDQIEQLEKQNLSLMKQTILLQEDLKQKDILMQNATQEYEVDKENLIEELNKLTKENFDIREEFSGEIKRIKVHEAKEFHELEAKVRQTIQKKDDCIYKLNQIITELKSQ